MQTKVINKEIQRHSNLLFSPLELLYLPFLELKGTRKVKSSGPSHIRKS